MALRVAAILKFNGEWRFTSPGPIASEVSNDFYNLIGKVVAQGNRPRLLAHFKSYFAGAAGMVSNCSSDEGWADRISGDISSKRRKMRRCLSKLSTVLA